MKMFKIIMYAVFALSVGMAGAYHGGYPPVKVYNLIVNIFHSDSHQKGVDDSVNEEREKVEELFNSISVAYRTKNDRLMTEFFKNKNVVDYVRKKREHPVSPSEIRFYIDEPFEGSMGRDYFSATIKIKQKENDQWIDHAKIIVDFSEIGEQLLITTDNLFD